VNAGIRPACLPPAHRGEFVIVDGITAGGALR
jgi:hypothetical protein